jgi:hypothetical protein
MEITRNTLTEAEAAQFVGLSIHFLRKDRRTLRRFPFSRVGDRILYRPERLTAALDALEEGGAHIRGRKPCKMAA